MKKTVLVKLRLAFLNFNKKIFTTIEELLFQEFSTKMAEHAVDQHSADL